ncbi:Pseudouridine-metabolizing bifunctional protein C1861.05 Includes: RecName: Full=Pseudouridine-5'-phosphate glycosidase {ECO:0000250/UniProtKB:P33025}; Short=PsiMP glycosidase {ECO:0000250/UniProtKB:P33025}; {ECO:0000250/UniProtKB:P33025}; Includes: RecName: Full=Pseudouridine kinase {ECO:0000250/UniProtKB:P30235}; {ECO:0000250/UniProtKB:P30235} [Serendipita indica DSM 11827]|nr:Pseudouridine-metabolizing bifunctional protein C1861.05 Includes: RecName: Full=Pseudouridine-5'-phosphate glycosidase {ECO:0000250/UniProtKB:P33025}; Short=PsiMP glycosidase {ECO:0000250/UniProtKB:P33025}; {ECO:0000250/UniProtKB:P33025}; Includes: RecName: Full=Pseudouridine kinase {ECO:0000250/UniProtKB:P30235}; {ECO:0000250/UniProtKB:P30235} [Serendipita indica DSM 11827]
MPRPTNLETALALEQCVRESGAIPATIGIVRGRIHVGLSQHQLELLADTKNTVSSKISRRDIAAVCAKRGNGGTTIAGTMVIAHLAGIKIFATGGLGGVHRGGENSLDISADLTELGRTPVTVFAGGVKSILDIGRTLEYLETQGVPVITYGKTAEFPAFFSPRSGFKSAYNVESPVEAADIIHHGDLLGLSNGCLFGCPIPEEYARVGEKIQLAVNQAVEESKQNGMDKRGKEVTPWLLQRVNELTNSASLENNIALLENAARIGGRVAVEYSKLKSGSNISQPAALVLPELTPTDTVRGTKSEQHKPANLVVIGGAAVDVVSKASPRTGESIKQSTVPGTISNALGGVGRNMAEAAHRLTTASNDGTGGDVLLVSPIGNDLYGHKIKNGTGSMGMRLDGLIAKQTNRTAVCNMVLDEQGDLVGGVADMEINDALTFEDVKPILSKQEPSLIALDSNIASSLMKEICHWAQTRQVQTFVEPTSITKSERIVDVLAQLLKQPPNVLPGKMPFAPITYTSPNLFELERIYLALEKGIELHPAMRDWWWTVVDDLGLNQDYQSQLAVLSRKTIFDDTGLSPQTLDFLTEKGVSRMAIQLLPFFQHLFIKCGRAGVILVMRVPNTPAQPWGVQKTDIQKRQIVFKGRSTILVLKHFPAINLDPSRIVNVTGAGDSLVGSLLATLSKRPAVLEDPSQLDEMIRIAQSAAVLTLESDHAVSPLLGTLRTTRK